MPHGACRLVREKWLSRIQYQWSPDSHVMIRTKCEDLSPSVTHRIVLWLALGWSGLWFSCRRIEPFKRMQWADPSLITQQLLSPALITTPQCVARGQTWPSKTAVPRQPPFFHAKGTQWVTATMSFCPVWLPLFRTGHVVWNFPGHPGPCSTLDNESHVLRMQQRRGGGGSGLWWTMAPPSWIVHSYFRPYLV